MDSDETIETKEEYQEVGPGPEMGFGDRVLSVFMAPGEVARSIRERPEWIRALILVAVITAVASVLIARENAEFSREMMSGTQIELSEEQLAGIGEVSTRTYVTRAIGGLFWTGAQVLLYSLVVFLCGKAMGGAAGFRRVFSWVSYVSLIGALGTIIMVVVVKLTGTFPAETSLAVLMGDSYWSLSRVALGNFEIFWLWQLVVLTLGLAPIQGFSVSRAAVSTVILFILRGLVLIGITAMSRQFLGVS